MFINPNTIDKILKFVFHEKFEKCGTLKKQLLKDEKTGEYTEILVLRDLIDGSVETYDENKTRGVCNGKIGSIIFHTHPIVSYAYPSTEDIMKVLKHYDKIKKSVIACELGIWVISNTERSNIYSKGCNDDLFYFINKCLNRIGKNISNKKEIPLIINKEIKNIGDVTHLDIRLFSWIEVMDGITLKMIVY